jgi:hypothetical protein
MEVKETIPAGILFNTNEFFHNTKIKHVNHRICYDKAINILKKYYNDDEAFPAKYTLNCGSYFVLYHSKLNNHNKSFVHVFRENQ